MKNDLLNEPSFQPEPDSEAVEARPIEPQRFMYQCPACNRLKFEILFIQENLTVIILSIIVISFIPVFTEIIRSKVKKKTSFMPRM